MNTKVGGVRKAHKAATQRHLHAMTPASFRALASLAEDKNQSVRADARALLATSWQVLISLAADPRFSEPDRAEFSALAERVGKGDYGLVIASTDAILRGLGH